ncbi:MAG: ATP-binding protein, partial [bacterium]
KQLKYFNNIKISGTHLMEMVNEILDLAKIEAGKMELDLKPFDFGGMLDGLTDIIKEEAVKKKLQIIKNIQPDSGWILGDEKRLKQVILNLLSNAMKFTEPGNRIGIDTRIDGDDIIVTVWDEGVGITEKDLDTIFDPFVQGIGGKASLEKGTGLGLSISKRLIELHRGTITVLSKEGEGSQFIISLPSMFLVEEQPGIDPSNPQKETILQPGKSARILVTEDNSFNRELIAAALNNFHLDFAVSGEDAVILVSDKDYDLVIMDIQLPGIDGIETLKQIRQIKDKKIPVIALTAFAMKGDKEKYLDIGFDDYLSKPIDISILIQKIENILS